MPGANPLITEPVFNGKYRWKIDAKPSSLWRFIPVAGALRIFRLGGHVTFDLRVTCIEINQLSPQQEQEIKDWKARRQGNGEPTDGRFYVKLAVGDQSLGEFNVYVPEFSEVGETVKVGVGPFFLRATGDAILEADYVGFGNGDPLYTFQIGEPGVEFVNWLMAITSAAIGAVVGGLVVLLANGS